MVEIPKAKAEVAKICIEYRHRSDINRQASPANRPIPDEISITHQPIGCALSNAEVNISTATSRQGKLTLVDQLTLTARRKNAISLDNPIYILYDLAAFCFEGVTCVT